MTLRPIVLVTGASSGIGAALAEVFAANGHHLALTARRAPQLNELADRIARGNRPRPIVIAADLLQQDAAGIVTDELTRHGFEVQFLVNNAGIGAYGAAIDMDARVRAAMIGLNVAAPSRLILAHLDSIVHHRGGILNVASTAAYMPRPGMAMYHATKAYLLSLTEALHVELAGEGVRVCALCPGPVLTEFFSRAGTTPRIFPKILYRSPERVAREGYEGLMAGRRVVIPGFANKVVTWFPRLVPRGVLLRMLMFRKIETRNTESARLAREDSRS